MECVKNLLTLKENKIMSTLHHVRWFYTAVGCAGRGSPEPPWIRHCVIAWLIWKISVYRYILLLRFLTKSLMSCIFTSCTQTVNFHKNHYWIVEQWMKCSQQWKSADLSVQYRCDGVIMFEMIVVNMSRVVGVSDGRVQFVSEISHWHSTGHEPDVVS